MTLKSSIFNIFQQFYEVFKVQIPKIGISEQELLQWNHDLFYKNGKLPYQNRQVANRFKMMLNIEYSANKREK
jgi:hypothetical protein